MTPSPAGDSLAAEFATHRAALFGAAYRVLGSVADADDVVQETWLRWAAADRADVRDDRAYLIRIATRLALNRLRQRQARREDYVGPWLPEPIATAPATTDPEAAAEIADEVSMAMLVVLETLSPLERAAFVMREVFDLPFRDIAAALDRSEPAVRQLAHRAREHVHARQPRQDVDPERHAEVTDRFLRAAGNGDIEGLMAMLAPDVVMVSDGGGKRRAALQPLHGPENVARWLVSVVTRPDVAGLRVRVLELNGEPAIVAFDGDRPDTVATVELGDEGITRVYLIRNPDKLRAVPALSALEPGDGA